MAALIARVAVDQVDWIGTSLGGHIGMEIAARENAPIRRLVLNDFGARIPVAALQRIGAYLRRAHVFANAPGRGSSLYFAKCIAPSAS
jgi:pimeloyl-ACP methyl ester carboxylesterase